ncbi:MAG: hypothetical protein ABIJ12_09110, partial [bacterium]
MTFYSSLVIFNIHIYEEGSESLFCYKDNLIKILIIFITLLVITQPNINAGIIDTTIKNYDKVLSIGSYFGGGGVYESGYIKERLSYSTSLFGGIFVSYRRSYIDFKFYECSLS